MSQKLLIICCFLGLPVFLHANSWKLVNSIDSGPEGIHLKSPMGIYYHYKSKKFYIVDSGNNRLISYSINGKPLKEFDAAGKLKLPVGMIKDSEGNLWIIERSTNSLVFVNLREKKIISKQITYHGNLLFPGKIDKWSEKIVILDKYSGKVFLLDKNFNAEKAVFPKRGDFKGFFDIKVKDKKLYGMETLTGRIFYGDYPFNEFQMITPDKKLTEPVSFDIDKNKNIYILDRFLERIFIFNNNGKLLNTQLKAGNRAGNLYYPWYLKIVGNNIFIINEGNGRVDIFQY